MNGNVLDELIELLRRRYSYQIDSEQQAELTSQLNEAVRQHNRDAVPEDPLQRHLRKEGQLGLLTNIGSIHPDSCYYCGGDHPTLSCSTGCEDEDRTEYH